MAEVLCTMQSPLAPGMRLAQYEIVGRLGAGGMGEVYRAHDTRLDRDVAIKVLTGQLADDLEMRYRFEREAKAVAALSHPSILSIHDLALVDGLSFAVMELLEGESLHERLARGPLPWRTAVEFGAQAADGLAAAHAKGIIHRDIKPENLFVLSDGRLKVLDFGLARPAGPPEELQTMPVVTRPGMVLGSMGYMAPEQLLSEPVGPPADVFALGCVIYEMVTAQRAFAQETAADTIAATLRTWPPPISELAHDVPPALERIVAHCLAKNPSARFASASDVASALRALSIDSSVSSPLPTRAAKSRSTVQSIAVLPFAYSGEPEADYLADGLTDAVINSLSQVSPLRVVPRSTVLKYKGRERDVTSVALALNVRSLVTGRVTKHAEVVTIQAELIDAATEAQVWGHQYRYLMSDLSAFEEELAGHITEALSARLPAGQKRGLGRRRKIDTEAYLEYLRGRQRWAHWTADEFTRAIDHFERAVDRDPAFALAWSGLAEALVVAGHYGVIDHVEAMTRGRRAARRALDVEPRLAEAHAAMGFALLFGEWDWQGAETAIARAIEINPRLAAGHAYRGLLFAARGRHDQALAAAHRACDLEPLSLLMNQILCFVLFYAGKYEESLTQARQVLALDEGNTEAHSMAVVCNEWLGRLDNAAEEWALGYAALGQGHDRAARMKTALATHGPKGYWEERLALAREIPHRAIGLARLAQSVALAHLGRLDEAIALLDEIVTDRQPQAVFLGADPFLQVFQAHSGFRTLLERVRRA